MSNLDVLWKYQQAELQLESIENEVKTTPSRVKLNKLHVFLAEQQSQIKAMEKQIDAKRTALDRLAQSFQAIEEDYRLELSEFESMEKDEECTAEEVAESKKSLEALLGQITRTRKELYDTLSWLEKVAVEAKETWTKAGKAKKEYDTIKAVCEEELQTYKPRLDEAKQRTKQIAAGIPAQLMEKYSAIKKNYAAPIAEVLNNQCGGCNMSLPMVVVKRVAASDSVVECENCGRILYAK